MLTKATPFRAVVALLCSLWLSTSARDASAALIQNPVQDFSGAVDVLGIRPFDPDDGTLERVVVVIEGMLSVSGVASGGPESFDIEIEQDFFSADIGRLFHFGSPARFVLSGHTDGAGGFFAQAPFRYVFSFTDASNLTGDAIPVELDGPAVPPTTINGTLTGFIESVIPHSNLMHLTHVVGDVTTSAPFLQPTSWGSAGVMRVEYDYEPHAPVPEPASALLLGTGVAALAARRLRRR